MILALILLQSLPDSHISTEYDNPSISSKYAGTSQLRIILLLSVELLTALGLPSIGLGGAVAEPIKTNQTALKGNILKH